MYADECDVCNKRHTGEQIPFTKCNFCKDSPSFHHGRCCPANPRATAGEQVLMGSRSRPKQRIINAPPSDSLSFAGASGTAQSASSETTGYGCADYHTGPKLCHSVLAKGFVTSRHCTPACTHWRSHTRTCNAKWRMCKYIHAAWEWEVACSFHNGEQSYEADSKGDEEQDGKSQ